MFALHWFRHGGHRVHPVWKQEQSLNPRGQSDGEILLHLLLSCVFVYLFVSRFLLRVEAQYWCSSPTVKCGNNSGNHRTNQLLNSDGQCKLLRGASPTCLKRLRTLFFFYLRFRFSFSLAYTKLLKLAPLYVSNLIFGLCLIKIRNKDRKFVGSLASTKFLPVHFSNRDNKGIYIITIGAMTQYE